MILDEKPAPHDLSDEEVLVLSRQTPSLFRILIDRYEAAFLRKARSIIGPREEVEDIVVEVFTKIYLKAEQFEPQPGASFKSWAYRILVNTACTYYQRLKRQSRSLLLPEESAWANVADPKSLEESRTTTQDYVVSTLSRMPTRFARILRQFFLEERTQLEIAMVEGLSVGAVKTRLHRAKKEFQKYV